MKISLTEILKEAEMMQGVPAGAAAPRAKRENRRANGPAKSPALDPGPVLCLAPKPKTKGMALKHVNPQRAVMREQQIGTCVPDRVLTPDPGLPLLPKPGPNLSPAQSPNHTLQLKVAALLQLGHVPDLALDPAHALDPIPAHALDPDHALGHKPEFYISQPILSVTLCFLITTVVDTLTEHVTGNSILTLHRESLCSQLLHFDMVNYLAGSCHLKVAKMGP